MSIISIRKKLDGGYTDEKIKKHSDSTRNGIGEPADVRLPKHRRYSDEAEKDLKKIYGAVNLEDAEYAKEEFREKWDKKYPAILRSWDDNWAELTTFFEYPEEIRYLIYTTNAVEAYHRMVRKFTKSKAIFPTDDSIKKVIFLSTREITKKWTMPVRDWGMAYSQFVIFFADRFAA